jgi:hypothetical protein
MSKISHKLVYSTSIMITVFILGILFLLVFLPVKGNFFGRDKNKVVATAKIYNYELRLNSEVSWDNYCKLTTLTVLNNANSKSQELSLSNSFNEHCLNGTGETGNNWFNNIDINNDHYTDIGVISGHSSDSKPTYTYFIYKPESLNFIKQDDTK